MTRAFECIARSLSAGCAKSNAIGSVVSFSENVARRCPVTGSLRSLGMRSVTSYRRSEIRFARSVASVRGMPAPTVAGPRRLQMT